MDQIIKCDQVVHVMQSESPDDAFYGTVTEILMTSDDEPINYMVDDVGPFGPDQVRPLILEEMGIALFAAQVERFIEEVLPQAGNIVLDVGNVNDLAMALTEMQRREP